MKRKVNTGKTKTTYTFTQEQIKEKNSKSQNCKQSTRKSGLTHGSSKAQDGELLQGFDISFFSRSFMIL